MSTGKTITWTLSPAEHQFWLALAREMGLSVGEYIYLLAVTHAEEHGVQELAPTAAAALDATLLRIGEAVKRRRRVQSG